MSYFNVAIPSITGVSEPLLQTGKAIGDSFSWSPFGQPHLDHRTRQPVTPQGGSVPTHINSAINPPSAGSDHPPEQTGSAIPPEPTDSCGPDAATPPTSYTGGGSAGQLYPQTGTKTAVPQATRQPEMDVLLETETKGAIYHDPKFVQSLLPGHAGKLQLVEEHCCAINPHYGRTGQWKMLKDVPREEVLYEPTLNILNTVARAVHDVHPVDHAHLRAPSPVSNATEEPRQLFIDNHKHAIPSDLRDTSQIKPDLVLFQDSHRHWEDVRISVEVKTSRGLHKAGMKQLSRYARATFAHQLHRRHLYSLLVCGTEVTFVRFDRAGILYSKPMDVTKDGKAFTRALASLLMLDRIDEGYDPAFTFKRNKKGRLEYYIDLPESAFPKISSKPIPTGRNGRMRRFKVIDILCHRQSICGRATIVLRIREELDVDTKDAKEYALKIIWRDPERESEGEILEQLHGRFGLAQSRWHCDVSMPGKCRCPSPVDEWCETCVDATVQVDGLQHVDTTEFHPTSDIRPLRRYSYILLESLGVKLQRAGSPRQFLTAVLDAILGYWGAFNLGIMHRDISDGNVMMLKRGQKFTRKEWVEKRTANWRIQLEDSGLIESETIFRSILEEIGQRDPTGMLTDFDLYAMHSFVPEHPPVADIGTTEPVFARPPRRHLEEDTAPATSSKKRKVNANTAVPVTPASYPGHIQSKADPQVPPHRKKERLIDFRTGTRAFMSIRVLLVNPGIDYYHHFFDDLESFFWLIIFSMAAHLDKGQKRATADAQDFLDIMDQDHLKNMAYSKAGMLTRVKNPRSAKKMLAACGNEWASDPMFFKVITEMGAYLSDFTEPENRMELEGGPGTAFAKVVRIVLDALKL